MATLIYLILYLINYESCILLNILFFFALKKFLLNFTLLKIEITNFKKKRDNALIITKKREINNRERKINRID